MDKFKLLRQKFEQKFERRDRGDQQKSEEKKKGDTKCKEVVKPSGTADSQQDNIYSHFTPEKIQELKDSFAVFDKNHDGMITKEELGTVMFALGQRPTARELQAIIRRVDIDRSGAIDFDEFLKIFSRKLSIDPEMELHEVFCIFDHDKDGFISPKELYEVLHNLGEKITPEEAQEMVTEADLNRDGKVDYREFKAILNFR